MHKSAIVLPGQFEFLSDEWLAEAERFLRETVKIRAERLGGRPFSVSERFMQAPPHLKFENDVAAWSLRYDGVGVSVSRGFDDKADLRVEGDYQAALSLAQFVGVLAPGGSQAMWRETRHMFGNDAVRVAGTPPEGYGATVLALLHDHLGRRTVENPDLAHRARRQGLSGKIREMEEQGYTVLERAVSPDFADELREEIQRAVLPHQELILHWMLYQGRAFELLTQHPLLMTLVHASLGRGAVIGSMNAIIRPTGASMIPLHADYQDMPEPFPEAAMTGVGVWAFEDWRVESGPTWIIPGSQKMRRQPRPGEGHNGGVPIEMPKGSVVFFTQGVWHWQGDRTEPGERITMHAHYNRGILRGLEPLKIEAQMLNRNPPALAELLGEADGYDKMSANGRDQLRLEHMRKLHRFTQEHKALTPEPAAVL